MIISSYTLTYELNAVFTTHPLKLKMDWEVNEKEVVIISSHTLAHKHNAFFTTHLLQFRMDCKENEKR